MRAEMRALPTTVLLASCGLPRIRHTDSVVLRTRDSVQSPRVFDYSVDLGDASGTVGGELPALFTHSVLMTVRYPLPFTLEAEALKGTVQVVEAGYGLQIGDVLRACSTPEFRYDSVRRRACYGTGIRGQRSPANQFDDAKVLDDDSSWLNALMRRANAELGGFRQTRPSKVLFVADGRPYQQVTDALVANTVDRGIESIVMLFERQVNPNRR